MLQEIFACFVSCLHWKAIFIPWKYFYSWILQKSYLYETPIWPEVLYKFDLVVTHLQIRFSRNRLTSSLKCWATKANYPWQTDFVLHWMPEPTKRNQKPLSPRRSMHLFKTQHLIQQRKTYLSESLVWLLSYSAGFQGLLQSPLLGWVEAVKFQLTWIEELGLTKEAL